MEIVNRYTFKLNTTSSATTFNIPINLDSYPVDQTDLIEKQFVDTEMVKAVNPIVDYETVRFSPINHESIELNGIIYKLNLLNGPYYSNAEFTVDDFIYRRNALKKSFLRLDFYDSPKLTNQNFLFSSTLFCRIVNDMFLNNIIKGVELIPLEFKLENPITTPGGISEGYYIYDYKTDVSINTPKEVYMRASFNNAKNGKTYNFMVSETPQKIEDLVNNIFTKYTLKIINGKYFYQLENDKHITTSNDGVAIINLYEIKVL